MLPTDQNDSVICDFFQLLPSKVFFFRNELELFTANQIIDDKLQ